jgi:hypothetical protein
MPETYPADAELADISARPPAYFTAVVFPHGEFGRTLRF